MGISRFLIAGLAIATLVVWATVAAWFVLNVWPRGAAGRFLVFCGAGVGALLSAAVVFFPGAVVVIAYMIFPWELAWNPDQHFYRQEFREVSGHPMPESAEFVATHSTSPHVMFGDYMSCAVFTVSREDYARLARSWEQAPAGRWTGSECLREMEEHVDGGLRFRHGGEERPRSDLALAWGLLEDGRTVVFQKLQW